MKLDAAVFILRTQTIPDLQCVGDVGHVEALRVVLDALDEAVNWLAELEAAKPGGAVMARKAARAEARDVLGRTRKGNPE